ncbi:MAG: hypothetical protein ACW96S_06795 [Promethearchaeota archaeon]|jgi:hypothetical protein
MDSIIFKVIFKATESSAEKNLNLSFKYLNTEEPLIVPANSIQRLKSLNEAENEIIYFTNIEEVIIVGNVDHNYTYNYYLVLLFTLKNNGERRGYLIGNVKSLGDLIIGIWPFNLPSSQSNSENVLENFDDIINNPRNYTKICLISQ